MYVIETRNVQSALPAGLDLLSREGVVRDSRNGKVTVMDGPVTTLYQKPRERVILWADRDANPFFHFVESLWMLAGRNDVEFVAKYVKRMRTFSDDGVTFHGAYGHRWLNHFLIFLEKEDDPLAVEANPINQVRTVVQILKNNPEDRRAVIGMWDPSVDLGRQGKDVPCNTQAYFSVSPHGELDMTVCNRSNDVIWGAYGANAVHFSMLQEFIAAGVGVPVGRYWQISNNYHAYHDTLGKVAHLADEAPDPLRCNRLCLYGANVIQPYPLVSTDLDTWMADLEMVMSEGPVVGLNDPFFRKVAVPIMKAHEAYANKDDGMRRFDNAMYHIGSCRASDWRLACIEWLKRRRQNAPR